MARNPGQTEDGIENGQASENMRLSLAYAHLDEIPDELVNCGAERVVFLDLSHNSFKDLSFLAHFPALQTLVLDRNFYLDCSTLPVMSELRILWLNNCNIINTAQWVHTLQVRCPRLRQLSMMCNPVGQTILNGVTDADEHEYRMNIIKLLPQLTHFDGVDINKTVREYPQIFTVTRIIPEDVFPRKLRTLWHLTSRVRKHFKLIDNLDFTLFSLNTTQASVFS